MASIAAMLLNYYDEEQAFVMLVRVWQLRGLEALYKGTGFEGLMSTLDTFEKEWLAGGVLARKLVSTKKRGERESFPSCFSLFSPPL